MNQEILDLIATATTKIEQAQLIADDVVEDYWNDKLRIINHVTIINDILAVAHKQMEDVWLLMMKEQHAKAVSA